MFIFKAIYKVSSVIFRFVFSLIQANILRLIWTVGKNLKCEGKVFIPSLGGSVQLGDSVKLGPQVRIGASRNAFIKIGNLVTINHGTYIISIESIEIGDNCMIGEYVSIRDNDHAWADKKVLIRKQGFVSKKVKVGNDVWIGRGAVICKGVTIGDGAVIGANSVVTRDVDAYSVAVGSPARVIKTRRTF